MFGSCSGSTRQGTAQTIVEFASNPRGFCPDPGSHALKEEIAFDETGVTSLDRGSCLILRLAQDLARAWVRMFALFQEATQRVPQHPAASAGSRSLSPMPNRSLASQNLLALWPTG